MSRLHDHQRKQQLANIHKFDWDVKYNLIKLVKANLKHS